MKIKVKDPREIMSAPIERNIQKYFSCIHGETLWQLSESITGALDDIFRPGIVVVTIATIRAGHFTIARVKLAALTQRKAVSLIGA